MYVVGTQGRPPEQAQVVWQRALELVGPVEQSEPFAKVIQVLSAARHNSTTLAHALALGRTQLRCNAGAIGVERAVQTLARAVKFLGVKPEAHTAALSGARHGA